VEDAQFIKDEVTKLLSEGIIEPPESPWRPQVLVTKGERHKRRMVDYSQTINRFTGLDAYPLPKIEQVSNLALCSWFSTLDVKPAYYQISINPEDKIYTAFEANGKLCQYRRLPFVVTNGVSAFQRIIDRLISQKKLKRTCAYLDNIIGGTDRRDHDKPCEIASGWGTGPLDLQRGQICHSCPPNWHTQLSSFARSCQARSWTPTSFTLITVAIFRRKS